MPNYSFRRFRAGGSDHALIGAPAADEASRKRRRWLREGRPVDSGRYVLYWMQMFQRAESNPALNEAIGWAGRLDLPLVVYQGLNPTYPAANDRIHTFILEGAQDTAVTFHEREIRYVFYLKCTDDPDERPALDMIRGSAITVVDDFPAFILPGITRSALEQTAESGVPVLAFDANGIVPMAEMEKQEFAARTIRPKLHRLLDDYLRPISELRVAASVGLPAPANGIEAKLLDVTPRTIDELVASCAIDHDVLPSLRFKGGRRAGLARLAEFVAGPLHDYADRSNDPAADASSHLSPYLHFGFLSPQEVAIAVLQSDASDEAVDAFLEQLVVRRELSYNLCRFAADVTTLDPLPDWAKKTLAEHADDPREVYSTADLERGTTDDEVWNAAQRELVATGSMHNYLRMLWGKNLIRWTPSYEDAQRFMIEMHHKYALDGRNPNTYTGILWCFGLHDRAYGETDVLGKLRPMTSASAKRKFKLAPYFEQVEAWVEERGMAVLE